jgi:hypothetical protein
LAKVVPRKAALDQERSTLGVPFEETDRASTVPMRKRIGLMLALPVGETDLEDSFVTIGERGRQRKGGVSVGKRISEAQGPLLFAFLDKAR